MNKTLYFEDFTPGQRFKLGPYEMSKDEIIEFASEFDPQPQHLSEEGGKASILGGLAASGWHVCAATMRMLVDSIFGHAASLGGLGAEEIRWMKPVRPGDVLSGEAIVEKARLSEKDPSRGYVTMTASVARPGTNGPETVGWFRTTVVFATRGKP